MKSNERQAASLVREYLQVAKLKNTLSTFEAEYPKTHGHAFAQLTQGLSHLTFGNVKANLIQYFDQGERGQFFNLWDNHVPNRDENDSLRLEFMASIYFAIYPVLTAAPDNNAKSSLSSTLDTFKVFLESRGAQLSQTPEFLPYYALPFMPDPANHPTFSKLFLPEWAAELRSSLSAYINLHLHVPSRISDLIGAYEQLHSSDTRLLKRHQVLQADYYNLLAIASELIGMLAATLDGQTISHEYIARVVDRMQPFRKSSSTTRTPSSPRYLNYDQIKKALMTRDDNVRTMVILLHALRLRVTSQPTPRGAQSVVKTYIAYDILRIYSGQPNSHLITHANPRVQEQTAKLLNLICSFQYGRQYVSFHRPSKQPRFLQHVVAALQASPDNTPIQHHLLGVLEKVSVLRSVQSYLIKEAKIMPYLFTCVLAHVDKFPDSVLVYMNAITLNILHRSSAKKIAAEAHAEPLLEYVQKLLTHRDPVVRSYVYGIMYAMADVPSFKDECQALGVPDMILYVRENGGDEHALVQQMDRLVSKLSSDLAESDWDEMESEDGSDCDDDEPYELPDDVDPAVELCASETEVLGDEFMHLYAVSDARSQGKLVPPQSSAKHVPTFEQPPLTALEKLSLKVSSTTRPSSRVQDSLKPVTTPQPLQHTRPSTATSDGTAHKDPNLVGTAIQPGRSRERRSTRDDGLSRSPPAHSADTTQLSGTTRPRSRRGTNGSPASLSNLVNSSQFSSQGALGSPLTRSRTVLKPPTVTRNGQMSVSMDLSEY